MFFLTSCFELIERRNTVSNVKVIPSMQDENLNMIKYELEEKFGTSSAPLHNLYISIEKSSFQGGITSDAYSRSVTVKVIVKYRLFDISQNKNIVSGAITKNTNYISESGKLVAERVGEKALYKNLSKQISDQIYNEIQEKFLNINAGSSN